MAQPKRGSDVIKPADEIAVYAILGNGGTLGDAADYLRISRSTLSSHRRRSSEFLKGCVRAEATGKLSCLEHISAAMGKDWRAAAWMLEKKHWKEYGAASNGDLASNVGMMNEAKRRIASALTALGHRELIFNVCRALEQGFAPEEVTEVTVAVGDEE